MWCPKCKTKSPTVAVGNDELICAKCRSEVVASIPRPKSRSVRSSKSVAAGVESGSKSLRPNPSASQSKERKTAPSATPEVVFASPKSGQSAAQHQSVPSGQSVAPEQTVASAQAVVKAWTDSHRQWRVDQAHLMGSETPVVDELESGNEVQPQPQGEPPSPDRKPSGYHMILFGLFVYLVGHGLTVWAFLAGHFGAWTIGSFCSVGGVSIAMVSVVQAIRNLEIRCESQSPRPPRKTIRKRVRRVRKSSRPTS